MAKKTSLLPQLRVEQAVEKLIQKAAKQAHLDVAAWRRKVLTEAAKKELGK